MDFVGRILRLILGGIDPRLVAITITPPIAGLHPDLNRIGLRIAVFVQYGVGAIATGKRVAVVADAPLQRVCPAVARQLVIALATNDRVIAGTAA